MIEGKYLRVYGQIKGGKSGAEFVAHSTRLITDHNEVFALIVITVSMICLVWTFDLLFLKKCQLPPSKVWT